jgi:hypothetical protein
VKNVLAIFPTTTSSQSATGDSGILGNAGMLRGGSKRWDTPYRMTNDTKWADRAFVELQNAAGNTSNPFGPSDATRWNPTRFLDTAEHSALLTIGCILRGPRCSGARLCRL